MNDPMNPDVTVKLKRTLDSLEADAESIRECACGEDLDWYDAMLRATFAKSYDFVRWVVSDSHNDSLYWAAATLRGLLEDIIVLTSIRSLPRNDRDSLLSSWMTVDTLEGMEKQTSFFLDQERIQSVLQPPPDLAAQLKHHRTQMKTIWMKHDLNPGHYGKGNIRELSRSSGLLFMYDFLYALTSRLVHFSPSMHLRSGWGKLEDHKLVVRFRLANFASYYTALVSVYSALLLAELIDRLGSDLQLSDKWKSFSEMVRGTLFYSRLPELVTYEEMNLPAPNILVRAIETLMREGKFPLPGDRDAGSV